MWNNDELEYSTDDAGDRIVKMAIGSNMLPKITVDTYQTFTGDSWEESELEYLADAGGDRAHEGKRAYDGLDWSDYKWTYNNSRELELLAEQCVSAMNEQVYADTPYEVGEVLSTYSPSYYNFETDSFSADYTLNISKLIHWARNREEWRGERLEDAVDSYLRERYASCDGFISYVTPALNGDYGGERLATLVWGLFHAWMEFEFNREEWFYAMFEDDYTIYMETRSLALTSEGWEKFKDVVVHNEDDHLLPDDYAIKAEYAEMRAEIEKYRQAETLPGMEV